MSGVGENEEGVKGEGPDVDEEGNVNMKDINALGDAQETARVTRLLKGAVNDDELANKLTTDQFIAYDIVRHHLLSHLQGKKPQQLLMVIGGEAGVGKSHLLHTIMDLFQ